MSPSDEPPAPGPTPVERTRGEHPDDASWRADALARSRHARLSELLVEPLEDRDPERAAALCAEVCRADLLDLAPALVLLPPARRDRAQAVAAWARTLFDFVRQSGLEGERLSQINRWEFELERALEGDPAGQPVFVRLGHLHGEAPFPGSVFEIPLAVARRRIAVRRPATAADVDREARRLGEAALLALGARPDPPLLDLASGVVRLRRLLALGEDRRRGLESLPADELPDESAAGRPATARELAGAVTAEAQRVRRLLAAGGAASAAPPPLRPAVRYARRAGLWLAREATRRGPRLLDAPPSLSLARRLAYLLLARFG